MFIIEYEYIKYFMAIYGKIGYCMSQIFLSYDHLR